MHPETRMLGMRQAKILSVGWMLLRYNCETELLDAQKNPYIEILRPRAFQLAIDQKCPDVVAHVRDGGNEMLLRTCDGSVALREEIDGVSCALKFQPRLEQFLHRPVAVSFAFIVPPGGDRWIRAANPRRREINRAVITEITLTVGEK